MILNTSFTSTNYIKAASVAVSLGATFTDYERDGIDPIQRNAIEGTNEIRNTFNFHSITSKGDKVGDIFKLYRSLEFGEEVPEMPQDHLMRSLHRVLKLRDDLHRKVLSVTAHINKPEGCYETADTKLASCLVALTDGLIGLSRRDAKTVAYYFRQTQELVDLVDAYRLAWGEYTLDPEHKIYHMKGVLENRENLISAVKRAQVLVTVKDQGKTYILSASATNEQIQRTIERLG